jgi:hypothetical protein
MAPSTKAVRPQVSKKQTKISTFGKITKTAPATTSPKAHAAKLPPADRVTEPTDPCLGAGKKRRHDAIDGEENCDSGEQATTPFVKKVRGDAFQPASTLAYNLPSRDSIPHGQAHLRKLRLSARRLPSRRNQHAPRSVLSMFRNALPPNPPQLQSYQRVSRVSSPSTRRS